MLAKIVILRKSKVRQQTVWVLLCALAALLLLLLAWYYSYLITNQYNPTAFLFPPTIQNNQDDNYTRTLVIAKLQEDDTSWVDRLVEEDHDYLHSAVYTVDNASVAAAGLTVPVNKGHEAMVYLTYIIDHYDRFDDVTMFMHAHRFTWHNNDFLDSDSARMVQRLRSEHVVHHGYMNLRCHQEPGCPDHIHPTLSDETDTDLLNIPEAAVIGQSWKQLFPKEPLTKVLSQPCCGQFAVSAQRLRNIPLQSYLAYRDWIIHTELEDRLSGRVWEYLWQFLFADQTEFCPEETMCYCHGYGVCFDPKEYDRYFRLRDEARRLEKYIDDGLIASPDNTPANDDDTITTMRTRISAISQQMEDIKAKAIGVQ
jgi:hypothetical protein